VFEYEAREPGLNSSGTRPAALISFSGRIRARGIAPDGAGPWLELHVVRDPARVAQEVADRHATALRDAPGQPARDGVVEAQAALGDELHDHGGNEGLRHAANPEAIGGSGGSRLPKARAAGSHDGAFPVLFDERHNRRDAGRSHEAISFALQLGLRRRGTEGGADERSEQKGEGLGHAATTRRGRRALHAVTFRRFAV
jgi:hypothetical protein